MKKLITFFTIIAAFTTLTFTAFADTPRVVDNAGIFGSQEADNLMSALDEVSNSTGVDVAVVTIDTTDGEEMVTAADDIYEAYGYGFGSNHDGMMLLISVNDRNYYISTEGYGITAITDAGIDYIGSEIRPYFSDGDYYQGSLRFSEVCNDLIVRAQNGDPYDKSMAEIARENEKKSFPWGVATPFSAIISAALGWFTTKLKKDELKSVIAKTTANDYMKKDSLKLTKSNEMFLYRNVVRTEKPKENKSGGSTTHTSSSGRTHGGGGGSF